MNNSSIKHVAVIIDEKNIIADNCRYSVVFLVLVINYLYIGLKK